MGEEVAQPLADIDLCQFAAPHKGIDDGGVSAASWLPQKRWFLRPKANGRTLFSLALSRSLDNLIERGIRKVKIKMKNSGTFRSDQGADAFLDLLSIVETTKKHNNSPYAAIRALF